MGICGFDQLGIKDPSHERHVELTEWIGDDFDPNACCVLESEIWTA
jgi:hypothetical protein